MIAIVDYGMGNLGSIANMLRTVGGEPRITRDPQDLSAAAAVILPGVGHFDRGMEALQSSGLVPVLKDLVVRDSKPVLGICLGMQLMTQSSEEGQLPGLAWVDAMTRRFPPGRGLKVPHMGWNTVSVERDNPLLSRSPDEQRFYFVHSYYVECHRQTDIVASAQHGVRFVAAFHHKNVFGVQFHPEKSHRFGLAVMKRFLEQC